MTSQNDANNREKSLGENVMIIALIALLMTAFLAYFFKQERTFTKVGFNVVASNFLSKIMAIRAQWFMDGQPQVIRLKENDGTQTLVRMNAKGWVDFADNANNCRNIWQAIIGNELAFMNQPVAVVEIHHQHGRLENYCRYSLPTGEAFDYYFETGKVLSSHR